MADSGEEKEGIFKRIGHGIKGVTEIFKAVTGKGGKGKGNRKVTNIVESIDVGAPLRAVYNQWTQFEEFPSFMKKVETVSQDEDHEADVEGPGLLVPPHLAGRHHRPGPRRPHHLALPRGGRATSTARVTFSGLAPNLTRVLVVLEYHPQGMFEKTGNIWRAQGRRARLELKHFRRQVMNQTLLAPRRPPGLARRDPRRGGHLREAEIPTRTRRRPSRSRADQRRRSRRRRHPRRPRPVREKSPRRPRRRGERRAGGGPSPNPRAAKRKRGSPRAR